MLTRARWGSQPQKPPGEATALSQGAPSQQASFPRAASTTQASLRALQVRGLGSHVGSLGSKLCYRASLRSRGPPTGRPACTCLPYLARLSHGVVVTLGLSRNVRSPRDGRAGGGTLKGWIPPANGEAGLDRLLGDFDSGQKGHLFPTCGKFFMFLVEPDLVSWADQGGLVLEVVVRVVWCAGCWHT